MSTSHPDDRKYSYPDFSAPGYPRAGVGANSPAKSAPKQPARARVMPRSSDGGFGAAVGTAFGFLFVIWAVFLIDTYIFGSTLQNFGVRPRDTNQWWGIFLSPLLHANFEHIMANSVPGAVFAGLIALTSKRLFWQVTIVVTLISGAVTWLLGGINTVHIGASGLIYGWLTFLIFRGFANRSVIQILLGVALAVMYSGLIWGVVPTQAAVSWEMHLFGAIAGIICAFVFKRGRQPKSIPPAQVYALPTKRPSTWHW